MAKTALIYHNPKCSTSRQVLAMIEAAGYEVEIIEYLKAGWTRAQLKALFAAAGLSARQALRAKAPEAETLGLVDEKSETKLIAAMIAHPVLVERPFVTTAKGALLARPKERVREIL